MLPDIMRLARQNPAPSGRQYSYSEVNTAYSQGGSIADGGFDEVNLNGASHDHRESILEPNGQVLNYGEFSSTHRHQASTFNVLAGTSTYLDETTQTQTGYGVA